MAEKGHDGAGINQLAPMSPRCRAYRQTVTLPGDQRRLISIGPLEEFQSSEIDHRLSGELPGRALNHSDSMINEPFTAHCFQLTADSGFSPNRQAFHYGQAQARLMPFPATG